MTQVITQVQARAKATVLAKFLAGISRKISLGQALDAISVLNDTKNWNVFCSQNPEGSNLRDVRSPKRRAVSADKLFPPVPAEVHTDDHVANADFDARMWLDQASLQDVLSLIEEDWRNCLEADGVAEFYMRSNSAVEAVSEHLHNMPKSVRGFECSVNGDAALAWLKLNKSDMFSQVLSQASLSQLGHGASQRSAEALEAEMFPGLAVVLEKSTPVAQPTMQQFSTLKALDVNMLDVVDDYDTPDTVPEWNWVKEQASFSHCGNNRDSGVYEYMVNVECINSRFPDKEGVPEKLRDIFAQANATNSVWVLFYQA